MRMKNFVYFLDPYKQGLVRKLVWALPVAYMIAIFALSAQPVLPSPTGDVKIPNLDKLLHFIEYLLLGAMLALAVDAYGLFSTSARIVGMDVPARALELVITIGVLYGMSDELHQFFVPGRSCDVLDFSMDVLGVIAAQPIFHVLLKRLGRRMKAKLSS